LFAALTAAAIAQSSDGDETNRRIAAVMAAGSARFQASHAVEDLRKTAIALSETVDQRALRTGDVTAHRRSLLAAFANLLRQIDVLADPAFDSSLLPSHQMTPEQTRRYNAQIQIAAAAKDTLSLLEISLHRFHQRAPDDTAALDEILRKSQISEARRAQIHAMY
jgi:hypothetical protein